MRKIVIIFLILAAGGIAYWLIAPLFITKEVHEDIAEIMPPAPNPQSETQPVEPEIISSGKFAGADNFHKAEGTAQILKIGDKYFVRFEEDFKVTNGPDLFVHFGKDGVYAAEARLGRLKGNVGSQNYEIPAAINISEYNEVWIWCRAFSVPFGNAQLDLTS